MKELPDWDELSPGKQKAFTAVVIFAVGSIVYGWIAADFEEEHGLNSAPAVERPL